MAVTGSKRIDLFTRIEETLGTEHATTMMELLPPVGWADVATKRDIDALHRDFEAFGSVLRKDLELLEARLQGTLSSKFASWVFAAMGVQTAAVALIVGLG